MNLHKYENFDNGYMKDYVYELLKKNIMELRLKPGSNLKKEKIASLLEVSITPVREAFAKLSEDELVDIYPQRGTYVSYINLKKVKQAKFLRENLERAVVKLTCEKFPKDYLIKIQTNVKMQEVYAEEEDYLKLFKLDNEFHQLLFEGSNKSDVWQIIQKASVDVSRMRLLSLAANFNRREVIADHQNIINAIKDKNGELAEKIMGNHIGRINFDTDKLKKDYPSYFVEV